MDSTVDLLDQAKRLYIEVVCAFYTDIEYIIADRLIRYQYIRSDEVESDTVLNLPKKFANRAINRLKEASLISSFDFHICQDVDGKSFKSVKSFVVYYIDYDHFVKVLVYRIHRIYQTQASNEVMVRDCQRDRFECPNHLCQRRYKIFDVASLYDEKSNNYICECGSVLREINTDQFKKNYQIMEEKINNQMDSPELNKFSILNCIEFLRDQTIHQKDPQEVIKVKLNEELNKNGDTKTSGIIGFRGTGRGGGGGRFSSYTELPAGQINIEVSMEDSTDLGKKTLSERLALPSFLIESTVPETLKRNERENEEQEVVDDDDNGVFGPSLFDSYFQNSR